VNGGHVHRAFTHISDANQAFQVLLDHADAARHQIFNIGNPGNNVTIREFAQLMLDLYEELTGAPATSTVEEISGEEFYGPGYEDGSRLPPDISKLRALGWEPRLNLRTTLRSTMQYYLVHELGMARLSSARKWRDPRSHASAAAIVPGI
jgi:UDP-apiose/xylose synthase